MDRQECMKKKKLFMCWDGWGGLKGPGLLESYWSDGYQIIIGDSFQ